MVSLKTNMSTAVWPWAKYPIKFEFRKKKYPMKIISEYNNWRQVITYDNIKGWIATHLLSSVKTGLILNEFGEQNKIQSKSLSKAKLLPQLLIEIKKCNTEWCKVIIIKNEKFDGWVKKEFIWGSTKNHIQ